MKRLIMATTVLVIASSPAMAWYDATGVWHSVYNGGAGGVGGMGGQGGAGGQGGQGGSAKSAAKARAQASTGPITVNVGTDPAGDPSSGDPSGHGWSGGGGTHIVEAPSPALALQPASGDDCPGVGLGAGGSGPTGAGILSYTWEGPHCTARRDAAMLIQLGHPVAATYVLEQASDQVRKALEWEARDRGLTQQHTDAAPVTYTQQQGGQKVPTSAAAWGNDNYCHNLSADELRRHWECNQ